MDDIRFYFSLFRRKFPYFLIIASVISAVSVIVATSLPPAYVSRAVLVVESPQIPQELASSTVRTPAYQQLQLVRQHLLTRENMLDIAYKLKALPELDDLRPDEIVSGMLSRTTVSIRGRRRNEAPLMTLQFESENARITAEVVNEYLTLVQARDAEFRRGRSGDTLEFFQSDVDRLSNALDAQSKRILELKQANSDALPESLQFRLTQLSTFQDRITQVDRDVADLEGQRERLQQLYELTGNVEAPTNRSKTPLERQLDQAQQELDSALVIYSTSNPRVKVLQARVDRLQQTVVSAAQSTETAETSAAEETDPGQPAVLTVQLEEISTRISALLQQKDQAIERIARLQDTIERTPEVTITLEDMNRDYNALQAQYTQAQGRFARAQTGDQIETRARGQRLAVVEQPSVPNSPTKPNRKIIAAGGTGIGIVAGLAVIVLLELLNSTPKRPEDIVKRLGITPLATIPYVQTRKQKLRVRMWRLLIIAVIGIGVPTAIYMLHLYYLPLDLIADRVMDKIGIRW